MAIGKGMLLVGCVCALLNGQAAEARSVDWTGALDNGSVDNPTNWLVTGTSAPDGYTTIQTGDYVRFAGGRSFALNFGKTVAGLCFIPPASGYFHSSPISFNGPSDGGGMGLTNLLTGNVSLYISLQFKAGEHPMHLATRDVTTLVQQAIGGVGYVRKTGGGNLQVGSANTSGSYWGWEKFTGTLDFAGEYDAAADKAYGTLIFANNKPLYPQATLRMRTDTGASLSVVPATNALCTFTTHFTPPCSDALPHVRIKNNVVFNGPIHLDPETTPLVVEALAVSGRTNSVAFNHAESGQGPLVLRTPAALTLYLHAATNMAGRRLTLDGAGTVQPTADARLDVSELCLAGGSLRFGSADSFTNRLTKIAFAGACGASRLDLNGFSPVLDVAAFAEESAAARTYAIANGGAPATLTLTGAGDDLVYNGTLGAGVTLVWAPDAPARALELGHADVCTAGAALIVSNGVLRIPAGQTCVLPALALDDGAKLEVGAGAQVTVMALTRDSVAEDPGYCSAAGTVGRAADWLTGAGCAYVPFGAPAESAATWTGNGGAAATGVTEPKNWGTAEATELPDLTSLGLAATFAEGGATATLASVRHVALRQMNLAGAGFTFAAGTPGAGILLGPGGIQAGAQTAEWTLDWALALAGTQTWSVANGNVLRLNAPLTSEAGAGPLRIVGGGTVYFAGGNAFANDLDLTNGTFYASGHNALGAAGGTVKFVPATARLHFGSGTNDRPIQGYGYSSYHAVIVDADATASFNGLISNTGSMNLNVLKGATAYVHGGLAVGGCFKMSGGGRIVVDTVPLNGGDRLYLQSGTDTTLDLCVGTNKVNGNVGEWADGRINTRVPYALTKASASRIRIRDRFVLDLCGNDQEVGAMRTGTGGTVTSATNAFLHLVANHNGIPSYDGGDSGYLTNRVAFAGLAGLSKEGTRRTITLDAASSTTGILQVVEGRLVMTANAKWPNAAQVTVKGGTLALEHAAAWGRATDVELAAGATLELGGATPQDCRVLTFDGVRQRFGLWGSEAARTAYLGDHPNAAVRTDARFTGTGLLYARGDCHGTSLIIR